MLTQLNFTTQCSAHLSPHCVVKVSRFKVVIYIFSVFFFYQNITGTDHVDLNQNIIEQQSQFDAKHSWNNNKKSLKALKNYLCTANVTASYLSFASAPAPLSSSTAPICCLRCGKISLTTSLLMLIILWMNLSQNI